MASDVISFFMKWWLDENMGPALSPVKKNTAKSGAK
jgi:hypothetical protein